MQLSVWALKKRAFKSICEELQIVPNVEKEHTLLEGGAITFFPHGNEWPYSVTRNPFS